MTPNITPHANGDFTVVREEAARLNELNAIHQPTIDLLREYGKPSTITEIRNAIELKLRSNE